MLKPSLGISPFIIRVTIYFAFISNIAAAQSSSLNDSLQKIDRLFENLNTTTPGAVLSITRNGEVLYQKAFGMADLEHNVIITKETIFEAGLGIKTVYCGVCLNAGK